MQIPPSDQFEDVMVEPPGERYALTSLAKAFSAGSTKLIRQWHDVLSAMRVGDLTVGSRTPVMGMPVWATPEVVRGGFATTAYAAGGALLAHEVAMAEALALPRSDAARTRQALNNWHLTDDGLERLRQYAASGDFSAKTPEETALLTVSLLLEDTPDSAMAILSQITPFFDRLRFYPAPGVAQKETGVFVRTVQEVKAHLSKKRPHPQIVVQHNTLTRWIPLNDRLIDLLAETGAQGWMERADQWCHDYEAALAAPTAQRWKKQTGQFQRARRALLALRKGAQPDDDVGAIVARHRSRYGDADQRRAFRLRQAEQDVAVWHDAVARIMSTRLSALIPNVGITDPGAVSGPIGPDEQIDGAPSGAPLPRSFERGIRSARMAPVERLVQGGQIGAPEVLAKILPQLSAGIYALGLPTNAEMVVCKALYRAFSSRRSLLLLNLESQVRLEEIPWADALLQRRAGGHDAQAVAEQALTELVRLSLTHFPHVIFPNPLIQEFSTLARRADLDIPFTNEIAADIFSGAFSAPFMRAAEISLSYYSDTLYARYYALPRPSELGDLAALCAKRSGLRGVRNWSVASNGMIIEQQQIITSHNLAQLLSALDLDDLAFGDMARRCFAFICKRQQIPLRDWRAKLQMTKNTAYAWRQMVAFMSRLNPADQREALEDLKEIASQGTAEHQERIGSALAGLGRAIAGEKPSDGVFLAWVEGEHPFAP